MPFYDPNSGKISDCKKGSYNYFHEKAHQDFQTTNATIIYLGQMSEFYTIIFIVLSFFINWFKWICLIGILIMIICFVYEEVYCNIKANEVITKKLKNKNIKI